MAGDDTATPTLERPTPGLADDDPPNGDGFANGAASDAACEASLPGDGRVEDASAGPGGGAASAHVGTGAVGDTGGDRWLPDGTARVHPAASAPGRPFRDAAAANVWGPGTGLPDPGDGVDAPTAGRVQVPSAGRPWAYVPGFALLATLGWVGRELSLALPLNHVLLTILLGIAVRNLVPFPRLLLAGVSTYQIWLKAGVICLGAEMALPYLQRVGPVGLALVLLEIGAAITLAWWVGRLFNLPPRLRELLGCGLGVCGVTAITIGSRVIEANEEETAYAVAVIVLFGATMIFVLPLVGHALGMGDQLFGTWSGISVDNTAETIATGFAFSPEAGRIATVMKMARNLMLGPVLMALAFYNAARFRSRARVNLWQALPKFMLGFVLVALLPNLGLLTAMQAQDLGHLSRWMFQLAFAGIGLTLPLSKLWVGWRPVLVGLAMEVTLALANLAVLWSTAH